MPFHESDEPKNRPLNAAIMRRMWERTRPFRGKMYLNLMISAFTVGIELAPPRLTKYILDVNTAGEDRGGLFGSDGLLPGTVLMIMLLWWVQIRRVVTIDERVVFGLREEIFNHLQDLSLSCYDKMKVGRTIARGTHVEHIALGGRYHALYREVIRTS